VFFFFDVGKNPLMTANQVRHSPFSYHIFALQMTAAIQAACVQEHQLSATNEQRHVRQSTFFVSLAVND
jgi:hypothetical protein